MNNTRYVITAEATMKGIPEVQKAMAQLEMQAKALGLSSGKMSSTFKTGSGKIIKATGEMTSKGFRPLRASISNATKQASLGSQVMGQYTKALMRVAIVVPIWQSFRIVIQTIASTIKEGLETIKKLNIELLRASSTIHGTTLSMASAMDTLKLKVRELSKDSGESMDKLANSFYRFGTVGNSFEDSMTGMQASLQTSLAMQGDVTQISKTMALTYKLLGDSIDDTLPMLDRQRLMGAQLFKLYRTNAFEINEMNSALMQFLPTANTANFTYAESISLLSALQSAGLKSSRAGRLLRTSIGKLVQNLDVLANELGIAVNPELESTFDILMKVLNAIDGMSKSGKELPLEQLSAIKTIFGGIRTQEAGKALVSLLGQLKNNLKDTASSTKNNNQVLYEFDQRVKQVTDSTSTLMKRNKNLKALMGEAFLQGITGSEDMNQTMSTLNATMEGSITNTKGFANWLRVIAVGMSTLGLGVIPLAIYDARLENATKSMKIMDRVMRGIKGQDSLEAISETLSEMADPEVQRTIEKAGGSVERLQKALEDARTRLKGKEAIELEVRTTIDKQAVEKSISDRLKESVETGSSITVPIKVTQKIEDYERQLKIVKEQLADSSKMQVAEKDLTEFVRERVKQHNNLKGLKKLGLSQVSEEDIITKALEGNYKAIVGLMGEANISEKVLLELVKKVFKFKKATLATEKEEAKIQQKRALELMSAQGATEIQIAERRLAMAITTKEVEEATHKLQLAHAKRLEKSANKVRGIFKDSFSEALESGDMSSFFTKFKEGMKDAVMDSMAEGLTNQLLNFSGLDTLFGQGLDTLQMEQAFTTGAMETEQAIIRGFSTGTSMIGGIGGGAGGGAGAGGLTSIAGIENPNKNKKPGFFSRGGGLSKGLGAGLLAFSLMSGSKGSSRSNNAFSTDPNAGKSGATATTRSTTIAKVQNVVLNVNVDVNGNLEDPSTLDEISRVLGDKLKQDVIRILNENDVASGNV